MGRPGPVLLFLYIDTYFRIQGLFIKHNHIISNLCCQNIFSMTKFIFATKAETYSLHYSWIWVRKIGGSFNWFCSRDQLVKLGIQKYFCNAVFRECQQTWDSPRFEPCFKGPYDPQTMQWSMCEHIHVFLLTCAAPPAPSRHNWIVMEEPHLHNW